MPCTLYVLRLLPPNHFYVGTTTRWNFDERLREHLDGKGGSHWTKRHGVHSVVEHYLVPDGLASKLENSKTIELMRRYGWQGVRGGDYTYSKQDGATWWLPAEFQPGGVSRFGLYSAATRIASASVQSAPSRSAAPLRCPSPSS